MKHYINYDFEDFAKINKGKVRIFLEECWREIYTEIIGTDNTEHMITKLNDGDLEWMLSAQDTNLLICFDDENILGTCMYASRYDITYIWGFYVHAAERGSGIGRKMLSYVAANALADNYLEIIVLEANEAAIEFYKHIGFEIIEKIVYEFLQDCTRPAFRMNIKAGSLSQ